MEDAPFPPKADDPNSTLARRWRNRLSDAEAVATTRLDMFGDNSLKEALAGGAGDSEVAPGAAEASPADEPLSAGAAAHDAQPATADLPPLDTPPEPPLPPSTDLQSLDPAVDVEVGLSAGGPERSDSDAPPLLHADSPGPGQSSEPEPDATAAATPEQMQVSAIFNALDAAERQAQRNDGAPAVPDMPGPTVPDAAEHNGWAGVSAELISRARREGDAVAEDAAGSIAATAEAPSLAGPAEAPPDPLSSHGLPGLSEGPPFPDPSGVAPSSKLSHPPQFFRSELEPPPDPPTFDADAQIAAEANATAEALGNLQRMLENNFPDLEHAEPAAAQPNPTGERGVSSPPLAAGLRMSWQPEPPPFAGRSDAPLLPLPLPPVRHSGKGIYLLGFLTGLGLSLMAGAVLYFFINMG